jgi:hypothetical protein
MIHSPSAIWFLAVLVAAAGNGLLYRRHRRMSYALGGVTVTLLAIGLTGWI